MNILPKFDPFAPRTTEFPAIPTVWATPGVFRAISSISAITFRVRWTDAESGSWKLTIRYPLSCIGMNPTGVVVNPRYVRASRPPYTTRTNRASRSSQPTA